MSEDFRLWFLNDRPKNIAIVLASIPYILNTWYTHTGNDRVVRYDTVVLNDRVSPHLNPVQRTGAIIIVCNARVTLS